MPPPELLFVHPRADQSKLRLAVLGPLPGFCGEGDMLTGLLTGVVALSSARFYWIIGFVFSKGLSKERSASGTPI